MISFLRGRVASAGPDHLVVETGGFGLRVVVPTPVRARLGAAGGDVCLYTHLQVREDAMVLYGFESPEGREAFDLLLTVSGVGPKLALAFLSALSPDQLWRAVALDDVERLVGIPGVGRKTAQRVALELREKVRTRLESSVGGPREERVEADPVAETVEALTSLGYGRSRAVEAVEKAAAELRPAGAELSTENLLRTALRHLAR